MMQLSHIALVGCVLTLTVGMIGAVALEWRYRKSQHSDAQRWPWIEIGFVLAAMAGTANAQGPDYEYAIYPHWERGFKPAFAEFQVPVRKLERERSLVTDDNADTIEAINAVRAKYEKPPLKIDPILMRVARERAPTYSHFIKGYGWSWDHAKKLGFYGSVTDDIAQGYSDGPDAVAGWERSDGHLRQMLGYKKLDGQWIDRHFDVVGVARSGRNFIAVFGRKES